MTILTTTAEGKQHHTIWKEEKCNGEHTFRYMGPIARYRGREIESYTAIMMQDNVECYHQNPD